MEIEPRPDSDGPFWIDDRPGLKHLSVSARARMAIRLFSESPDIQVCLHSLEDMRELTLELCAMVANPPPELDNPWVRLSGAMEVDEGAVLICQKPDASIVLSLDRRLGENVFAVRAEVSGQTPLVEGDLLFRELVDQDGRLRRATVCEILEVTAS